MDPLSIAAGAAGLAGFAIQASNLIYQYVSDVKSADSTLSLLYSEVKALQSGLENVDSTFRSREVVRYYKSAANDRLQSAQLLSNVRPLLTDCESTLAKLNDVLGSIEGSGSKRGIFRKPVQAFKLNSKSDDINLIRHQIRSYSGAMQMTLQMVGM